LPGWEHNTGAGKVLQGLIGTGKPDRAVREFAELPPYIHSTGKILPIYEATLRAGYHLVRQQGIRAILVKVLTSRE
jgi:hypothetical protein